MFNRFFFLARCQQCDCSYDSKPIIETGVTYEIERLRIKFFETDDIILDKPCGKYDNKDVYVTANCAINLQGNGCIKNVLRSNIHKENMSN